MALGSDDDDDDDSLEGSNSGVSGEEMFNRCINTTLEAQEVRQKQLNCSNTFQRHYRLYTRINKKSSPQSISSADINAHIFTKHVIRSSMCSTRQRDVHTELYHAGTYDAT